MLQHTIKAVTMTRVSAESLAAAIEAEKGKSGHGYRVGDLIEAEPGVEFLDYEIKLTGVFEE